MKVPFKMETPIAPAPIRWPLSFPSETVTSDHASAACYCGFEDEAKVVRRPPFNKMSDASRGDADLVLPTIRRSGVGIGHCPYVSLTARSLVVSER
jgi:hypothetical protein